ncbi:unnamed protein product [Gongylonema pulchrum]|uniref:Mediator complex subunit 5 n=1 Tax=Gongylonema pulchrum TaxID=637853 RepID=A0A183EAT6_9BILA|nr:unnamed protein product [Gongylonema pulchrum]
MIRGDQFIPIHAMVAELGSESAMFVCYSSLSPSLPHQLSARIHWLIAIKGAGTFPAQICKNHLRALLAMFQAESETTGAKYQSLMAGHELITKDNVQNLLDQMDRCESLKTIQRLFDDGQYDKVINIIVDNFSWKDVDRNMLLTTALTLVDSYIELSDMDNATLWISRVLDFTKGLAGTDKVVERLRRIVVIENVALENVSNLVHCIVPLLVLHGYESDSTLWLLLYRCACRLEGELTVNSLSALYDDGCEMYTSSLNILVTAHEAVAKHDKCPSDNVSWY